VLPTVGFEDDAVVMIDQRLLPHEEVYLRCRDHRAVAAAIQDMAIRGAPAIGVAAAYGLALGVRKSSAEGDLLRAEFAAMADDLAGTRPTAVNLFWAIARMKERFAALLPAGGAALRDGLLAEATAIDREDVAACRRMGDIGAELLPNGVRILTHCNAGRLATAGYGTALGVIRSAARMGRCWGLRRRDAALPPGRAAHRVGADARGHPRHRHRRQHGGLPDVAGEVDAVVVGADRIARNGDVANKIGTYSVAVLAKENGCPSTWRPGLDLRPRGDGRCRHPHRGAVPGRGDAPRRPRLTPEGVLVRNPAFDVTPARYVTAIVCERGVARRPTRLAESPRPEPS
jgi:methylthioribose-1-phosphate isomerase